LENTKFLYQKKFAANEKLHPNVIFRHRNVIFPIINNLFLDLTNISSPFKILILDKLQAKKQTPQRNC